MQLHRREHPFLGKQLFDVLFLQHRQGIGGGSEISQTPLSDRHFMPFAGVAIAVEDNRAVIANDIFQNVVDSHIQLDTARQLGL